MGMNAFSVTMSQNKKILRRIKFVRVENHVQISHAPLVNLIIEEETTFCAGSKLIVPEENVGSNIQPKGEFF